MLFQLQNACSGCNETHVAVTSLIIPRLGAGGGGGGGGGGVSAHLPQCFFGILAYDKVPWQQLLEELFQRPWEMSVVLSMLSTALVSTILADLITQSRKAYRNMMQHGKAHRAIFGPSLEGSFKVLVREPGSLAGLDWLLRDWGGSTLLAFLVTAEARPCDSCLLPCHANKKPFSKKAFSGSRRAPWGKSGSLGSGPLFRAEIRIEALK